MARIVHSAHNITVVEEAGKFFVSGLYWRVLTRPNHPMREAREYARQEREATNLEMEVVALRQSEVHQVGFVAKGAGATKSMYSLAAVLADTYPHSYIAVIDVGGGNYAVAASIDGTIIPESDAVLPLADAKRHVDELWASLSGNTREGSSLKLFAPEALAPGNEELQLADLIPKLQRKQRLRRLSWFSTREIGTALAVVALLIGAGGWYADHSKKVAEQKRLEEVRKQAELRRLAEQSGRTAEEIALSHPWSSLPSAETFTTTCVSALRSMPISFAGWMLAEARCAKAGVSATYAHAWASTPSAVVQSVGDWKKGATAVVGQDGQTVEVRYPLEMPAGGDDPLGSLDDRTNRLRSALHLKFVGVTVTDKESEFAARYVPQTTNGARERPAWRTKEWSLPVTGLRRNPQQLIAEFPKDGVRVMQIRVELAKGSLTWHMKGEIYGR